MTRAELIKKIETERNSRVISYATGDRPPFATKIAGDIVPLLGNLLDGIGKVKKISLLLYTSGGDMLAPIRIVKLIRNHCDEFEALVPYKAHSAAQKRFARFQTKGTALLCILKNIFGSFIIEGI